MATKNAPSKSAAPKFAGKTAPAKAAKGKPAAAPVKAAKNKPAAQAPVASAARGRAQFSGTYKADDTITLLQPVNPKRGASRDRYDLYRDGMTVSEFIAAGGRMADVRHDVGKQFISVTAA